MLLEIDKILVIKMYRSSGKSYTIYKYYKIHIDECCPNEKIKMNHKNRSVWINKNMKSDIEKREELFKMKLKEPSEENINLDHVIVKL